MLLPTLANLGCICWKGQQQRRWAILYDAPTWRHIGPRILGTVEGGDKALAKEQGPGSGREL